MNPKYKQPWIDALRSGSYLQGREQLKQTNAAGTFHCCLGVLREVACSPWGDRDADGAYENPSDNESRTGTLSHSELCEFGLTPHEHRELYEMNDSGTPFAEIAEYIEHAL